jgi:hypothetical protein
MKKIYISLFALTIVSSTMVGQLTLTKNANAPAAGDVAKFKQYDSTTTFNRQMGTNKVWNFSSVNASTLAPTIENYAAVSSVPNVPATFSMANLASYNSPTNNPQDYTLYKINTASYELLGTFTGTQSLESYTNTVMQAVYPFTYGSFNSDSFSGSVVSGTTTNLSSGSSDVLGSGTGTVILPGNLTFANCLQVKNDLTFQLTSNTPPYLPLITATFVVYDYYHSSQKFPIASLTDSKTSFLGQITTQHNFKINGDVIPIVGLEELNLDKLTFNLYPNPAKDKINISTINTIEEEVEIQVVDITGKILKTETLNKGSQFISIRLDDLSSGIYLLQLKSKNGLTQKRFVKE